MRRGQLTKIMSSIRRFGVSVPIVITKDRVIVHGHGVWEAARQLGIDEMSCVVVDHLTPTEERMLAIALNRLGETGTWDFDALRLEFEELTVLEEDLVVTGFEAAEIDMVLLSEEVETPEAEAAGIPALADVAVSRTGDVWLLGDHRLTQGDAQDAGCYARILDPAELAQLVRTDAALQRRHQADFGQHASSRFRDGRRRNGPLRICCLQSRVDGGGRRESHRRRPSLHRHRLAQRRYCDGRRTRPRPRAGYLIAWSKSNAGLGSL